MQNNIISLFQFLPNDVDNSQKWDLITTETKRLLSASDYTQLPDSGLSFSKKLEWQMYRDDLRSIRDDFENPDDVILPTPPAEE